MAGLGHGQSGPDVAPFDATAQNRLVKELETDDEQMVRALVELVYMQGLGPLLEVICARQGTSETALKYYGLRRSQEASPLGKP